MPRTYFIVAHRRGETPSRVYGPYDYDEAIDRARGRRKAGEMARVVHGIQNAKGRLRSGND